MSHLPAALLVRLAAALLPVAMRDWGRAMVAETQAIRRAAPALRFASGCLWGAFTLRLSLLLAGQELMMPLSLNHVDRPRRFAAVCAAASIGLGFAYMAAAGAPLSYFAMNAAAFALGIVALGVLSEAVRFRHVPAGFVALLLSGLLLVVSLWGVSADGVTRWVALGGVVLQPSLVLVPALALIVVHSRDGLSVLAIMVAALALALQPDRAMAGALVAAMAVLALGRFEWRAAVGLVAALLGSAVTLVRPDASPAMAFVDQIFFSSFATHPLAGLAVVTGAALMLVPAILGLIRDPDHRTAYATFGAVWLAVIVAAALGNYPTPLVGFGGSAILGYLISLIGLPARAGEARRNPGPALEAQPAKRTETLRARLT